jgi:hypothetical protein
MKLQLTDSVPVVIAHEYPSFIINAEEKIGRISKCIL